MTETEQLRAEIAALRHVIKHQAIDLCNKDTAIETALHSLRMSNNMYIEERTARRRLERQLAQYEQHNRTCAALGIQPVANLYTAN